MFLMRLPTGNGVSAKFPRSNGMLVRGLCAGLDLGRYNIGMIFLNNTLINFEELRGLD
jgi:hypothetical protein